MKHYIRKKHVLITIFLGGLLLLSFLIYMIIIQLKTNNEISNKTEEHEAYIVTAHEPISVEGKVIPENVQIIINNLIDEQSDIEVEDGEHVDEGDILVKTEHGNIVSTHTGTVYFPFPTDIEATNDEAFRVVSDQLLITSDVSQFELEELEEDMSVTIREIVSDFEYNGSVLKKAPYPGVNSGSIFQVLFSMDGDIHIGYDVIVSFTPDNIPIPLEAINKNKNGDEYVYILENDEEIIRKVDCEKYNQYSCFIPNDNIIKSNEKIKINKSE